jgi:hypothetical protein
VLRRLTVASLPALVLLAGCGSSRTNPPSLTTPAAPLGFHALGYPRQGVALLAPKNWSVQTERAPMVTLFSSGTAVVAVYRFPRSTPPPVDTATLDRARIALLGAARARDPGLRLIRSKLETVGRARAIELDAFVQINGRSRRVRSIHVYVPGSEVVLDEYAPPAIFHTVDHAVFSPVRRSLHVTGAGAP